MNKNLVSIKGTSSGLVFTFNRENATFKEICLALEDKLMNSGDFFIHAEYIIAEHFNFNEEELSILAGIMDKYQLRPGKASVKNDSLGEQSELVYQAQAGGSVLITRSIRTGTRINVRGNAVIMGDINNSAEVVATGSIIVMGTCRGILHAGAEGDRNAFILVHTMAVQQVRIANLVATVPAEVASSPLKLALVRNDQIVLTDYSPTQFREVQNII